MEAKFYHKGDVIDYTPESKVEFGAVVPMATRIGIAAETIPAGALGHLHTVGVFEMAKKSTDVVALGAAVYYDATEDEITTTSTSNTAAGYAVAAAASGTNTVLVKIG